MKKNLLAFLMIAGIIFATSCNKDEVEEPTLTLAASEWQAPMEAAEKTVAVTTNQTNWTAVANAEWIEMTQSGNSLTIKVAKNMEPVTRKAVVKVIAGGIGKDIAVAQVGTNVTIVTIPDKLEVDSDTGTYQFDVDANIKDWTITSDADWVKVTPKQFKHEVIVEIAENTTLQPRVAKLTLTGGKTNKEFVITQKEIMYFILPYMGFGEKTEGIHKFELERKSKLVSEAANKIDYQTRSKAFDIARYLLPKGTFKEAVVFTATKEFFNKELNNFKKFLTENGFEDKGNNVFFHANKNVEATIMDKEADPYVHYKLIPKQPKAYPTFAQMPYGLSNWLLDDTKKVADVEKNEKDKGAKETAREMSKVNPAQVKYLVYHTEKTPEIARWYFFNDDQEGEPPLAPEKAQSLSEFSLMFDNINLALWNNDGEWIVTKEMTALLTKEGFKFESLLLSTYHFYSKGNHVVVIAPAELSFINGGKLTLRIAYFKRAAPASVENTKNRNWKENDKLRELLNVKDKQFEK